MRPGTATAPAFVVFLTWALGPRTRASHGTRIATVPVTATADASPDGTAPIDGSTASVNGSTAAVTGARTSAARKTTKRLAQPPALPAPTARPVSVFHSSFPTHDEQPSECDLEICACGHGQRFNDTLPPGPLRRERPDWLSSLIRLRRRETRPLPLPLEVSHRFLEELLLLHDNPEQLRALLTLASGAHATEWLAFLNGYEDCEARRDAIFTCVQSSCHSWNLNALRYVPDVFVENVLGVEIAPPALYVLVGLKNPATNTTGVIRVPTANAGLLDVAYNLVRASYDRLRVRSPLPQTLAEWRQRFPSLYSRPPASLERLPAPLFSQLTPSAPERPVIL